MWVWWHSAMVILAALAARIHTHRILQWMLGGVWKRGDRAVLLLECARILWRPTWLTPSQDAVVRAMWLVQWRKRYSKAEVQILALWIATAAEWWLGAAELGLLANVLCFIF